MHALTHINNLKHKHTLKSSMSAGVEDLQGNSCLLYTSDAADE